MKAPSEAAVHEEHQTGSPPFTSNRYVYVDRFLCMFVYTSQDQVTFNMYPNFDM